VIFAFTLSQKKLTGQSVSVKQFLVVANWQELEATVEVAQNWPVPQSASREQLREEIEQLGSGSLLSDRLLLNFQ
jgi:hypothetical protein